MSHTATLRPALFYALLVLAVWVPFTLGSGMPHEHSFAWESEHTSSVVAGFVRADQPTRLFVPVFHHAAYLLGEIAGAGGSFVPYQIVFACLWWARGFLVFLILRRLLPEQQPFAAAVGGLVLLHGSDHVVSWVGVMAIYGALVWALLCVYAWGRALEAETARGRWLGAAAAASFAALSLWTYEGTLPLLAGAPPLLLALKADRSERGHRMLAPLACVGLAYLAFSGWWYVETDDAYQRSVLRSAWSPLTLAADLWFNVAASVSFWSWGREVPDFAPADTLTGLASLAAVGFAGMVWAELWGRRAGPDPLPGPALARRLLAVGAVLVLLAFPVFLLLEDVRSLWRTQLLSGPGCALVLGAVAAGLTGLLRARRHREVAFVLVTASVAWFGARAVLNTGAWHRSDWDRHREVIARILEIAPDLAQPTVFLLVGVPRDADPFLRYNRWFEFALKLAYPDREVAGIYFRDDGTPAPGPSDVAALDHPRVLALELTNGDLRPLARLPDTLPVLPALRTLSSPADVIGPGPATPRALRRYGVPSRP